MTTDLYPIVVELDDVRDSDDDLTTSERSIQTTLLLENLRSSSFRKETIKSSTGWDEESFETEDSTYTTRNETGQERRRFLSFPSLSPQQPNRHRRFSSEPFKTTMVGCDCRTELAHRCKHHRKRDSFGSGSLSSSLHHDKYSTISGLSQTGYRNLDRPRRFHDEYVLTQQIERCQLATLWICIHRATGQRYCVKAIDKRRFTSRSDRETALREIRMVRAIQPQESPSMVQDHLSCIPRIRDIFVDDGYYSTTFSAQQQQHCHHWYIVQDFVAGGCNLEMYLRSQEMGRKWSDGSLSDPSSPFATFPISESKARLLIRSLLLALNELHQHSICHNDVCPENILMMSSPNDSPEDHDHGCVEGDHTISPRRKHLFRNRRCRRGSSDESISNGMDLKLCDLGRAYVVSNREDDEDIDNSDSKYRDDSYRSHSSSDKSSLPCHSSLFYTSPEVLSGKARWNFASDLWSVGIILYQSLSGELPFTGIRRDELRESASSNSLSSSSFSIPPPSSSHSLSKKQRSRLKREILSHKADGKIFRKHSKCQLLWSGVSRDARQCLMGLLHPNPKDRWTCEQALSHSWLAGTIHGPISPSGHHLLYVPSLDAASTNHYKHHPSFYEPSILGNNNHNTTTTDNLKEINDNNIVISRTNPNEGMQSYDSENLTASPPRPKSHSFVQKLWHKLSPVRDKPKEDDQ